MHSSYFTLTLDNMKKFDSAYDKVTSHLYRDVLGTTEHISQEFCGRLLSDLAKIVIEEMTKLIPEVMSQLPTQDTAFITSLMFKILYKINDDYYIHSVPANLLNIYDVDFYISVKDDFQNFCEEIERNNSYSDGFTEVKFLITDITNNECI